MILKRFRIIEIIGRIIGRQKKVKKKMWKKNEKKKDWTESKLREQRSNTEQT